jgi:hypothetical protein
MSERKPPPASWPRNLNDPNDAMNAFVDEPLLPGTGIYFDESGKRIALPTATKKKARGTKRRNGIG